MSGRGTSNPSRIGTAKFKKVFDNWVAFRDDDYAWWQVAESTFDNFMIRTLRAPKK